MSYRTLRRNNMKIYLRPRPLDVDLSGWVTVLLVCPIRRTPFSYVLAGHILFNRLLIRMVHVIEDSRRPLKVTCSCIGPH